jgi:hypothetical protein
MAREIDLYLTDDMPGILKRLGLLEDAEAGKLSCYFCGKPVNLQNIGGIFKHEGKVCVVCNDIKCLFEAAWLSHINRLSTRRAS